MVTLSCRETEQHCRFLQLGSVTFYIIGTFSYLQDVTVLFLLAMQTQIEKNPTHPEDVVIPQWLWSSKAPCKRQISIRRHRKELHLSINIDLNTTSVFNCVTSICVINIFHLSKVDLWWQHAGEDVPVILLPYNFFQFLMRSWGIPRPNHLDWLLATRRSSSPIPTSLSKASPATF